MTKHKWHKEIKAWADGAEIEGRAKPSDGRTMWYSIDMPYWASNLEYRIKPQPAQDLDIVSLINKHRGERTFFDGELLGAFFTVRNLEGLVKEAIEKALEQPCKYGKEPVEDKI